MTPELQTIIKQYNAAPEPVQQTIYYGEVEGIIRDLGITFTLDENTRLALENHVTLILLLVIPRNTLEAFLTEQCSLAPENAETAAFLIDTLIIVPTFTRIDAGGATQDTTVSSEATTGLPRVRTMAEDEGLAKYGADEPSYTSLSQDELTKREE